MSKTKTNSRGSREKHTLLAPHRHHGKNYGRNDTISLYPDQVDRLRKHGKIASATTSANASTDAE